jgi:benzoyl-CoA reductase/2-hydroxyglutaryl-CoA dehydratase subunit BcrC/BadD/HgdB
MVRGIIMSTNEKYNNYIDLIKKNVDLTEKNIEWVIKNIELVARNDELAEKLRVLIEEIKSDTKQMLELLPEEIV